jgi:cell wall-associated NlpC family hydrolase
MRRAGKFGHAAPVVLVMGGLALLAAGCAAPKTVTMPPAQAALEALQRVKNQYAPDSHLAIFTAEATQDDQTVILQGEVDDPAARKAAIMAVRAAGFRVREHIVVLPGDDLGGQDWGLAALSLVNLREKPGNTSEMGTQAFMGNVVRLWKTQTNWFLAQTADKYLGWTEGGSLAPCTRQQAEAWQASPLLIVTALEERIVERPSSDAPQVSDVVQCDLVQRLATEGEWFKVGLPDGRAGYLPQAAAADYAPWRAHRRPTPENIESTARSFMGRPYFWGCNSVRGLDCSGFTKLVYYLNGVELSRNAAQQCLQGVEVPVDDDLKHLQKGDLLFFGRPDRRTGEERVTHVAIYLQDKLFIQSAVNVHLSSLDASSPLRDSRHNLRTLLHVRRVLPNP